MAERKYKYDAFISYRHTELDKYVAENLIKQLESYKLPGSVAKKLKGKKTKIERVFRDREELPLTNNLEEPIVDALQNSEWLIVICSPRLPESMWCKKEIETFISLRGREHVLAVLIEGEPAESFPEELLFKTEEITKPDGTVELAKVPVEPLAADFRGKDKKAVLKAMKTEILRVLAAMFGVPYDDLRQRHRERKMRRIMTASSLVGAVCLLFGIYSTVTALQINAQKEQIEAQSEQILEQSQEIQVKSEEIQKQNVEITKQNEELALRQAKALAERATQYLEDGNREVAISTAVEALTESENIQLPYTSEAQYVLTDSLRIYDTGDIYKAEYQVETSGKIEYLAESPDSNTLVICDATGMMTLYDLERRETILSLTWDDVSFLGEGDCAFLNAYQFVYMDQEDKICVYDMQVNSLIKKLDTQFITNVFADKAGNYLVTEGFNGDFEVFDGKSFESLGEVVKLESEYGSSTTYMLEEGVMANTYFKRIEGDTTEYGVRFVDLESRDVSSKVRVGNRSIMDIKAHNGVAYIQSSEYSNGYLDCDTYLTAVSMENGQIQWEQKFQGHYSNRIELPGNEEGIYLLNITNSSMQLVDIQTGEVYMVFNTESPVAEVNGYYDRNDFLIFYENGQLNVLSVEYGMCFDLSDRFQCKTMNNTAIYHSSQGISVLGANDNKVTVYTPFVGPDVQEISEVIDYPEDVEQYYGDSAFEIAKSYGLERPEFVNCLFYSEDQKHCLIYYWDNQLVIYDVVAGKVLNTITDAYKTNWYLGTDAEGLTYLLGYTGCYVLDKDMEPVAWIDKVINVNLEQQKVYFKSVDDICYEAPVYELQELLQFAETRD